MRFLSVLVLAFSAALPATAQECRHAGLIRSMTEHRLSVSDGGSLATLNMVRAAYLLMQYAELSGEEIEVLLDDLADRADTPAHVADFRAIYDLSYDGGLARWRSATPAILNELRAASPALLRALILADGGETFLRLRSAALPEDATAVQSFYAGPRPALYLSDQSDAFRASFAGLAEESGAIWLAGAVTAGHSDPQMFDSFMVRQSDVLDAIDGDVRWRFAPYSDRLRQDLIAERSTETAEYGAFLAQELSVQEASLMTYPISFLGLYHTQSGGQPSTYLAAQAVLRAATLPQIDPLEQPDYFWQLAYEVLLHDGRASDIRALLAGFDWGIDRRWHGRSDAVWHLDQIVATATLQPYLRGDVDTPPPAPQDTVIDWDAWTAAARHLRQDKLMAAVEAQAVATVELLWSDEQFALAWGLALANADRIDLARLSLDLATRLDMLCDQRTILPDLNGRWGRERLFHFE